MTRINLVPVEELTDQHLFAEFREIKMVPKSLKRSLASRSVDQVLARIPSDFTLNRGHVTFFYNKGAYLAERYEQIKAELEKRGVNFNRASLFDPDKVFSNPVFNQQYSPTPEAYAIIRQRIAEKIAMKPNWYRKTQTSGR